MTKACTVLMTVIFLIALNATAKAQGLPQKEQQILSELETSLTGFTSWKCTGVLTENPSQHFRDDARHFMSEIYRKRGVPAPTDVEYSSDYSKVFLAALKGRTMLYAEKKLNENPVTFVAPPSDVKTLDNIRKTGVCTVTSAGETHETVGEVKSHYARKMAKPSSVPAATEGFYVETIGITPREAILQHGFRFVREEADAKFGRVLVFSGTFASRRGTIMFYLAPDFGYRVVYSSLSTAEGQVLRSHRINSLVNIQGFWLPKESEDKLFLAGSDANTPDIVKTYRFFSQSVNDVPENILTDKLLPGDYEWDEKTNVTYKIGANGERIFQDFAGANSPRRLWPGWLYMASVTSLLVLTVLAYIRWKRRQLSNPA